MAKHLRVLIVEDSEDDALLMIRELERGGYETTFERVETAEAMAAALKKQVWDIIFSDYSMPHFNGLEALKLYQQSGLDLPFIIISGTIGEEVAVLAMKAGAHDYLMKDNLKRLVPAIERELRDAKVRRQRRQTQRDLNKRIKELECLYGIAIIAERPGVTLDTVYQEGANMIPQGWQYPDITCARVTIDSKEFKTPNFRETAWKQDSDIIVDGQRIGAVEVFYLEEKPEGDEGPFLNEERNLINGIAKQLGDFIQRKQAEEVLKKTQRLLTETEKIGKVGGWEFNIDTEKLTWTEEVFNIHEVDVTDDLTVSKAVNFYTPASMPIIERAVQRAMNNGEPFDMELEIITAKGNLRNVHAIGKADLEHHRVYGFFQDITERKQAEEELRNSERRLAQAIEGNSIPTFIIDNNHIITHWNKSCEKLTGFSASEVVGTKKQWAVFYSEERPVMADFIVDGATEEEMAERYKHISYNKSVLIERAYEGENFYPDLGEKGKWLFFTASPLIDQQGKIVGAIETFQDITERRSMEDQLRQAQKMEAIGTLAGGIAHDFNNILTTIIGNASLALTEVGKDGPLREEIEEIKIAGERASDLTRQLLAFSRKQIVQPKILELNELLTDMEKMLGRLIGEDVELLTIQEPALWQIEADFGQMEQVIINLAINARDAMPKGGKLTIETANVDLDDDYFREHSIREKPPGSYVMIAVSDTGIGMDKETQEHIFEPFYTTKEIGKGTGLGLSTVYGIVKQNNGFIWTYSEPGQGTTFKIYLPKVEGDTELKGKKQTPVLELGGSETVLIVEDDDSLRKLAQKALQQHGYKVLEAENGEEALRVSKEYEGSIDLMITDVVMPRMSGKETAERLQPLYPRMKVLYMSGYTDNAIVNHGILAPGLNFFEKPFTLEGLARKVREILNTE